MRAHFECEKYVKCETNSHFDECTYCRLILLSDADAESSPCSLSTIIICFVNHISMNLFLSVWPIHIYKISMQFWCCLKVTREIWNAEQASFVLVFLKAQFRCRNNAFSVFMYWKWKIWIERTERNECIEKWLTKCNWWYTI